MKRKLHLFNPENDLALALGCRNYTPPPHAAALHRAGALFPAWWAEDGDVIYAPSSFEKEAEWLRSQFGLNCNIISQNEPVIPLPWGWSLDAKRQFLNAIKSGIKYWPPALPSDEQIEQIRQLSHRRSSIKILRELDLDVALPVETSDPNLVIAMENTNPGCFIKSPWSSSGRGVFNAVSLDETTLCQRVEGIIRRQGSVMVERGLHRTMDFAALFHASPDGVKFKGLSIFNTENRGLYCGNLVAPQHYLEQILSHHLDIDNLHIIIYNLERILSSLIGCAYTGWLGIDMMTYMENGMDKIMPCVELNLRMTMGVAAMKIQEKLNLPNPHTINWVHGTTFSNSEIEILPPHEGFSLQLCEIL
ncbi:MAG: hypothetical protein NC453_02565 [Muribaculum sp.]|nr:hypothetical protein [Muribaculum sp.]